jgi:Fuc2NAc and GlcNAc transferase
VVASAAVTALGAALVAAVLTRIFIEVARRRSILAIPNERSSHAIPTPTLGGAAIALPVLVWTAYRVGQDPLCWSVVFGGGALTVLGLLDDLRDLSARVRFPIQCVAVGIAIGAVPLAMPLVLEPFEIRPKWLVAGLDFLIVLWMVNLYNFMDGIDGIAASQCIVFCAGVLLIGHPAAFMHEFLWLLLGATAGFLWFNRPPARIFMGDVASGLLGLLVGVISLTLDARGQMPLVASLILLAGFWFDATYTLCVRIATGQKFASAHRSHLYQRYAGRFGHGRTTAMFIGYALMWLMPLAWLCTRLPQWSIAWLLLAILPLAVAAARARAGLPDETVKAR